MEGPVMPAPLTMFSFGHYGSGNATEDLVAAVATAEAERGFARTLWVDIRIRRGARARGFRGDAFAKLLGAHYEGMQDVGNEGILDRSDRIRIRKRGAAGDLLDKAIEDPSRRVIFFCSCKDARDCHRRIVAKLLIDQAKKHGLELTVSEWPGSEH
jgi:hypothetical protein